MHLEKIRENQGGRFDRYVIGSLIIVFTFFVAQIPHTYAERVPNPFHSWFFSKSLNPTHFKSKHPKAKFIAHPESESQVLDIAHYIGSTSGLLNFVQEDNADVYIVATEAGILHEMKKRAPHKTFIPAPVSDDTCACSECGFMKLNTLEKLYLCLKHELPEINLDPSLMAAAKAPIDRMLVLS